MTQLIVSKNKQCVSATSQLNMLYRLIGFIVLLGSLYLLLYPEVTGKSILGRGQLNLQMFSIPGIFLSLLAFMIRKVEVDLNTKEITLSYGLPILSFYKKIYALSFFYKMILSVDNKPPNWSSTGEYYEFVKPWYHVAFISNKTNLGTEVLLVKSTNAEESKNIAEVFSEYTKIPLETLPNYPV